MTKTQKFFYFLDRIMNGLFFFILGLSFAFVFFSFSVTEAITDLDKSGFGLCIK